MSSSAVHSKVVVVLVRPHSLALINADLLTSAGPLLRSLANAAKPPWWAPERIPAPSILSLLSSRLPRRRATKGALTPSFSTQPDQKKQAGEAVARPLVSSSCTLPALSLS